MRYIEHSTALTYLGGKEAALYFDYVVPASQAAFGDAVVEGDLVTASIGWADLPSESIVRELLPPSMRDVRGLYQLVSGLSGLAGAGSRHGGVQRGWAAALLDPQLTRELLRDADAPTQHVFADAARCVSDLAVLNGEGKLALLYDYRDRISEENTAERLCATVRDVKLVDSSALTWEQIHEFRKDETSRMKLRALRRFVYQNYAGKDPAFVRDDLMARISEYEDAARLWNFDLKSGLLSVFAKESWISALWAAAGGITGGVAGALAAGTVVIGSQVTLKINKRRHEVGLLRNTSPLAYIIALRDATGESQPTPKAEPEIPPGSKIGRTGAAR